MKFTIKNKSNFSFDKAVAELKNIQNGYLGLIGEDVVQEAKHRIMESDPSIIEPLTSFTKRMRREGRYWGGKSGNQYKTNSEKPLVHTGRLLKSIKKEKNGVSMIGYAKIQNDGWNSGGKWQGKVPAREFLIYDEEEATSGTAKSGFQAKKNTLVKNIEKSMKSKTK